jgi:undecaprenyl pyrophosphate phosphatase UppP
MRNSKKGGCGLILTIIGIVVALAAIAAVMVLFRDEIEAFFLDLRDKIALRREEVILPPDEVADYADV